MTNEQMYWQMRRQQMLQAYATNLNKMQATGSSECTDANNTELTFAASNVNSKEQVPTPAVEQIKEDIAIEAAKTVEETKTTETIEDVIENNTDANDMTEQDESTNKKRSYTSWFN